MLDGTRPHEQHVNGPARSQRDMVQASLAHEQHPDTYRARRPDRTGWRARLAHVEALLADGARDLQRYGGETLADDKISRALIEVRSMIDGE